MTILLRVLLVREENCEIAAVASKIDITVEPAVMHLALSTGERFRQHTAEIVGIPAHPHGDRQPGDQRPRRFTVVQNAGNDRIAEVHPDPRAALQHPRRHGRIFPLDDRAVGCEPFFLWVIEGDRARLSTIPFEKAGLDVIITDDLESYRTRKVRILNGAHTCSVPVGLLCGFNNVEQLVTDEVFGKYIKRAIFTEIIPSFSGEKRKEYAAQVIERFHNPFLDHKLFNIALNSLSKWKTRVLPSVVDYMEKFGKAPEVLTFSFAALYVYYKRGEGVRDDAHFLELTKRTASLREFLKLAEIWGEDLSKREMFTKKAEEYEKKISEIGIKKVVEELASEA